jgi:hypothetical protein
MDYHDLVKRLSVPDEWVPPTELTSGDVRAVALSRDNLDDDVAGINASLDLIRRTRGGPWPAEPVTADYNSRTTRTPRSQTNPDPKRDPPLPGSPQRRAAIWPFPLLLMARNDSGKVLPDAVLTTATRTEMLSSPGHAP